MDRASVTVHGPGFKAIFRVFVIFYAIKICSDLHILLLIICYGAEVRLTVCWFDVIICHPSMFVCLFVCCDGDNQSVVFFRKRLTVIDLEVFKLKSLLSELLFVHRT